MNDYLSSISNIDESQTEAFTSAHGNNQDSILLSGDPPLTTSALMIDEEDTLTKVVSQYLSPKKIIIRKYTLKKG